MQLKCIQRCRHKHVGQRVSYGVHLDITVARRKNVLDITTCSTLSISLHDFVEIVDKVPNTSYTMNKVCA